MAVSLSVTTETASMPVSTCIRRRFGSRTANDGRKLAFRSRSDADQAGDRPGTDSACSRGLPQGVVLADARLLNRHLFPYADDQDGSGLCDGSAKHGDGVEAGRGTQAGASLPNHGSPTSARAFYLPFNKLCPPTRRPHPGRDIPLTEVEKWQQQPKLPQHQPQPIPCKTG